MQAEINRQKLTIPHPMDECASQRGRIPENGGRCSAESLRLLRQCTQRRVSRVVQKRARRELVLAGGSPNPKSPWCFVSAVCTQMGAPPVQPWCFHPLTCTYTQITGIASVTRRRTNGHCCSIAGGNSGVQKSVHDAHPSDDRRLDWIAGGAVNAQNQNWHGIHEQPLQPDILAQTTHGL